jgi:hypothetical protein
MPKTKQRNNLFLVFLISCFFIFYYNSCFGAGLEVAYPTLSAGQTIGSQTPLPDYLKYIFDFGISIGFLATIISLIIAGVLYILSPAKPELKASAMDRIYGTITGFIILVLIYLIITTINPALKVFKISDLTAPPPPPTPPAPAGLYLYTDVNCPVSQNSTITPLTSSVPDLEDLTNRVKSAKISQGGDINSKYVAILYDTINFKGGCQYINPNASCVSAVWQLPGGNNYFFGAASASVYNYNFNPNNFDPNDPDPDNNSVVFYRKSFFNKEGGWLKVGPSDITGIFQKPLNDLTFSGDSIIRIGDINENECTVPKKEQDCVKWDLNNKCLEYKCPALLGENISSIKIDGDYVVALLYWDPILTQDKYKWLNCQIFPTVDDVNKEGPRQIKWEYIRNQNNFPNWVVIFPVKSK